jgi:hypothetical protein
MGRRVEMSAINDVLQKVSKTLPAQDHTTMYRHGVLEPDHDPSYFRIYRNPRNRRSYSLIKRADVAGEIYEWKPEEALEAGFVGATVHLVPLKFGSEVQHVTIRLERVGEKSAAGKSTKDDDVCCCDAGCQPPCGTMSSDDCDEVGENCPGKCG